MLRELQIGARGQDVVGLQNGLNENFGNARKKLAVDGIFGNATLSAVEAFQTRNPGTGNRSGGPDGIVGKRTWRKLFPLAVYSVNIVGMRLVMPRIGGGGGLQAPRLGPGPLQLPGTPPSGPQLNPSPHPPQIDWSRLLPSMFGAKLDFKPVKFPGLRTPIFTPPEHVIPLQSLKSPTPVPPPPNGLVLHKLQLGPGVTTKIGSPGDTAFSFSAAGVYVIGDDDKAHGEFSFGTQLSAPPVDGSGSWSISWFAQIASVDHLGKYGKFHLFGPYAQLGGENTSSSFRPVIKGSGSVFNVSFDLARGVSVAVGAAGVLTYDPATGRLVAGVEGSAGLSISIDMIPPRRN